MLYFLNLEGRMDPAKKYNSSLNIQHTVAIVLLVHIFQNKYLEFLSSQGYCFTGHLLSTIAEANASNSAGHG